MATEQLSRNRPDEEPSEEQLKNRRKAFDLVDSWVKLLATLATGTLVLSATFIKDVIPEGTDVEAKMLLFAAWVVLGVSTMMAALVLQSLIAHLNNEPPMELDVYGGSIVLFASLQFLTFVGGIAVFAWFVGKNL